MACQETVLKPGPGPAWRVLADASGSLRDIARAKLSACHAMRPADRTFIREGEPIYLEESWEQHVKADFAA